MRTSYWQYVVMIEFMENYGDLSKATGGSRDRHYIQRKWQELTKKLNGDATGDSRSEEKWRKVWSDYKNNTKKKAAKINRANGSTEGPGSQLSLTDLESRVLKIIGIQVASGTVVTEACFPMNEAEVVSPLRLAEAQNAEVLTEETPQIKSELYDRDTTEASFSQDEVVTVSPLRELEAKTEVLIEEISQIKTEPRDIEWNTPGTSNQPPVAAPLHTEPQNIQVRSIRPRKYKKRDMTKKITAMEYARERDRNYERLENERLRLESERLRQRDEELRLREFELRERVRQRDVELQLQTHWLEFMKEAMKVFERYIGKKD